MGTSHVPAIYIGKSEDFRINKRRLARLPHESALTYVVGFSV